MQNQQRPNIFSQVLLLTGLLYACHWIEPYRYDPNSLLYIWFLWLVTAITAFSLVMQLLRLLPRIISQLWIRRPKGLKGTAKWATLKQARKASTNKRKGFLAGMMGKVPIWLPIESSGLVLSPAGGGKTVGFVIPALMSWTGSMIVADLKGTLAAITAFFRRIKFRHKTFILNPAGRFGKLLGASARFNPLQTLNKDWANPDLHKFLMSDAQMLAKQLLPEPTKGSSDVFFRNGSRKLLVFSWVYLATTQKATLSAALALLSDVSAITNALYAAVVDNRLNGDLARMAKDLLAKLQDGSAEQFESFREGALQVLEPYSPSGVLADATSDSDFCFADLRLFKATVYIICDPTQMEAFASWLGLVMESAKTELIRNTDGGDVTFLIDEATNFKFGSLPGLLTTAREFKLRIWVVVQELEQWAHVYGREALDTLLSQTEVKIIHGSRSFKTCQLVSNMLGDYSVNATSYNKGASMFDPVGKSVSETGRKMLMPDEVARFDKVIVFYGNMPPMALDKIGYHEIAPWRSQAAPNPLFGKKRYKGKVRLRV